MKFAYKYFPTPDGGQDWWAVLPIQIANPARHSPPTKRFEALIDSGASLCLFHGGLARPIGLELEKGERSQTTGISGQPTTIYLHEVSLYVPGGHLLRIRAGFSNELPLAGLLGRQGFFDKFRITFDSSSAPPGVEMERIYVA